MGIISIRDKEAHRAGISDIRAYIFLWTGNCLSLFYQKHLFHLFHNQIGKTIRLFIIQLRFH